MDACLSGFPWWVFLPKGSCAAEQSGGLSIVRLTKKFNIPCLVLHYDLLCEITWCILHIYYWNANNPCVSLLSFHGPRCFTPLKSSDVFQISKLSCFNKVKIRTLTSVLLCPKTRTQSCENQITLFNIQNKIVKIWSHSKHLRI